MTAPHDAGPALTIAGEYGATSVILTKEGVCCRLAFGRAIYDHAGNRSPGYFHGAVILSPEAIEDLKAQIVALGL